MTQNIFYRIQSHSEVSDEQLRDRESATAVEEETCSDPIPSVSSSGVPGTSGMNYQRMMTASILSWAICCVEMTHVFL